MDKVEYMRNEVERHMNEIARLFKPGMKLTFIARATDSDEQDVVLTIDDLNEVAKVLAQAEPVGQVKEKPGSHGIWVLWTQQVAPGDYLYLRPPSRSAEAQAGKWTDRAFAALGYLRDNMPPNDVTIVQRFLDAAAPESEEPKP